MSGRKKSKKNKPNQTGRNEYLPFVKLEHRVMDSEAYRSLSPNARSLLFELIRRHKGKNNGALWLSVRDGAALMGVVDLTAASNAFDELEEMKFIVCTAPAHFSIKASHTSRARCWRLTFESVPGASQPATHDYMHAVPKNPRAKKRAKAGKEALSRYRQENKKNRMPVLDSKTLAASFEENPVEAVLDSTTANPANDENTSLPIARESNTHTITMGVGGSVEVYDEDHSTNGKPRAERQPTAGPRERASVAPAQDLTLAPG